MAKVLDLSKLPQGTKVFGKTVRAARGRRLPRPAKVLNLSRSPARKRPTGTVRIVVLGTPVSAPRMTKRDKWQQRPAVVRYRDWKDAIRVAALEAGVVCDPDSVKSLSWTAYFAPPASWNENQRLSALGELHRSKPDRDNLDKAVLDALFGRDEGIADGRITKRWSETPRLEVEIEYT